ncbi:alpha/beta fold hydrolase [Roseateles sp.]|uniref:alpha/beta fold hydrolase n=1 Tax=Roseateles sp. TaxID=1971397 RepID=UPI003BA9F790
MTNRPDPVLVLIHGAMLSGAMWAPVRRHLDPRLQVFAPDLPGHGTRRGERFTLDGAVQAVLQAVHAAAPAPVLLVGDSLGGYTALATAAAMPAQRLLGIVAGGCTARIEQWPTALHFRTKVLLFKLMLGVFSEARLVGKSEPKVRRMLLDEGNVAPQDADAVLAGGMGFRVFEDCVRALWGVDHLARLQAIRQPVWLLNGDQDRVMLRQEPRFLAAGPHVRGQRFDCGHGVSLVRSREFAALVNRVAAGSLQASLP